MSRVELPDGTVCLCGHGPVKHLAAMDGECVAPGCGCKGFRDRAAVRAAEQATRRHVPMDKRPGGPVRRDSPATPTRPPGSPPVLERLPRTVDELVERSMQSGVPHLVKAAERLVRAAAELQDAFRRQAEREAAQAEVARLRQQLREAELKAGFVCECGQVCASPAGLGAHQKRVHGMSGKSRSV